VPGAEQTIGGRMKFGWQSRGVGISCGPTKPTEASKETEELFFAVQAVAAAKGSDLGDGGSSVQMPQRRRSRVARIRRKMFWLWRLKSK
jgi:hypothetical protein